MTDQTDHEARVREALCDIEARTPRWIISSKQGDGYEALPRKEREAAMAELIAAVAARERARCREAVEKEHAVILRDVKMHGWNVNKAASDSMCVTILAAIDRLGGAE